MDVTGTVLAQVEQRGWVGPGLIGFVVIVALIVATVLLWRSMNKQLKKVRFDRTAESTDVEPSESASGSAGRSDAGPVDGPGEADGAERPGGYDTPR